jgi:AMMECR1 domain-containing protein
MELNIKQKIIDLARSSIKFFLDTNKKLVVSSDSIESEFLKKGRGVFVTLTKNNHLRGCIGYRKCI